MNPNYLHCLAVAALFIPCLASGQQPASKGSSDDPTALTQRGTAPPAKSMEEDVEVMRRLLERNLRSVYGISSVNEFVFWANPDVNSRTNLNRTVDPAAYAPYDAFMRSH